jgi:hypothetical protein
MGHGGGVRKTGGVGNGHTAAAFHASAKIAMGWRNRDDSKNPGSSREELQ